MRTGLREEGQYLQFWMLTQRFIGIFGNAIPFALLGQVGYVPNTSGDTPQNEDVGRVIGLLVNVMQAVVHEAAKLHETRRRQGLLKQVKAAGVKKPSTKSCNTLIDMVSEGPRKVTTHIQMPKPITSKPERAYCWTKKQPK